LADLHEIWHKGNSNGGHTRSFALQFPVPPVILNPSVLKKKLQFFCVDLLLVFTEGSAFSLKLLK
jgi:hypothetical protein